MTEVQVQFRLPPVQLFNRPAGVSDAELQRLLHNGSLCLIRPNVLTIELRGVDGAGSWPPGTAAPSSPGLHDARRADTLVSVPAVHRLLIAAVVVGAALGMTACSSTSSSSSASSTTTPTTSTGPAGSASGQVPAVANATNLKTAPVVSAGTPPPPTSLLTKDLVVGTGTEASTSNTVVVQYVGANYADGKVFDSSWQRGGAATFPLSGVIPGFAQGIVGMKVGGRRVIVIPAPLGYGAAGSPPAVAGNETLVFVVDLVSVK